MIEKDLAHLRFLHNVCMKGGYLNSSDLDFVIQKKQELEAVCEGIEEILETQRCLEMNL